jgi:hypothetical protein
MPYQIVGEYRVQVDEVRIRCVEEQWADKFNEFRAFFDFVDGLVGTESHTLLTVKIIYTLAN